MTMTLLQVAADTTQVPVAQGDTLLGLLTQAGGFQWPILAVLAAGLLALALASMRLVLDLRFARTMAGLPVDTLDAQDFEAALENNEPCLYRRLLRGMMQVWYNAPLASALGHEAGLVLQATRAAYGRTQRLVGFLSSTAGGLGLLGTLAGIYALFSAQTRDAQTIFAGIAIAVVSTLLGIVVSIILELLESLVHSWASRYHERAEAWATRVRYRLLALCDGPSTKES